MSRHLTRPLVFVLLLIAALAAGSHEASAKPPKGITWDVKLGYNGLVQKGRVNTVVVDMENNSAGTNLSGDLVLLYGGIEYSTRLELPTPSKKRFHLYFPCEDYPPTLTVRVRTKGYTEEKLISAFNNTIEAADLNVLVLSNQKGSLGVVNQQITARMLRDIYNSETAELGPARVMVSYLRLDECEANPKFFSTADVVVLADVDYQQLGAEMSEALRASLAGGKTLVFSLGLNGPALATTPLATSCPLQVAGTATLTDLGAFGQTYSIDASRSAAIFATGSPAPGAQVLSWAGQRPAVLRQQVGSGAAIALAFDFTQVPFKQNVRVADIFNDHVFRVTDTVQLSNWFLHPGPLEQFLSTLSEAKPMEPQFVLLFLAAYVVLIGPLNFFILDRFKRRTLVWTTIPLIVAGFSYLGLMTGYIRRGAENVTAYLQEMHVFPGAAYTPYQTIMLIFTSERTRYELTVPDQSAFLYPTIPSPDPFNYAGTQTGLAVFTGGRIDNSTEPQINITQGKWDPKTYYYQGYRSEFAQASSALVGLRGEGGLQDLSGSFSLDLPYDLHRAYLFAPGFEKEVGTVAGQGSYEVSQLSKGSGGADKLDPENYLAQRINELVQRQKAAASLALGYRDEALLVGFTEDIESLAKFNKAHKEYRLNMVVVHLPYSVQISDQGDLVVSRALLTGGKEFSSADQRWNNSYQNFEHYRGIDNVVIEQNGYVDMEYELAGDPRRDSSIHISLQVRDKNDNNVNGVDNYLKVEFWNGTDWAPAAVADGSSVDIKIGGLLGRDRKLRVRFTSLSDRITFALPDDRQSVY